MSLFKPGGLAHDALAHIALGGATKADVRRALRLPRAKQTRANALIENLRADGLVSRRMDGGFWLTVEGQRVLQLLARGQHAEVAFGRVVEELAA